MYNHLFAVACWIIITLCSAQAYQQSNAEKRPEFCGFDRLVCIFEVLLTVFINCVNQTYFHVLSVVFEDFSEYLFRQEIV